MKILFSTSHFGFLRNFQSTLRMLAEHGHRLHLVADRKESMGGVEMIEDLLRDYPNEVTYEYVPVRKHWTWYALTVGLRLSIDYWRYLDPRYLQASRLRSRAANQVPPLATRIVELPVFRTTVVRRLLMRIARFCERAMPVRDEVRDLIKREQPDLIVLTPLLYFGSMQVDHVRAARAAGVPTLLSVGSWDHLTTKGLIHEVPDGVTVWNEAQKQEAGELHGVPPERVVVTGAPAYDYWFASQPSISRAAFCSRVGLPEEPPILLYLCSSPFITPHEVGFVRSWLAGLRRSADRAVREASVLIRPHPQNAGQWHDVDLSELGAVIWPRAGANPIRADARAEYFDSMYFSAAVVGVNTSALIESGVVGRPVLTVLLDEFSGTQEGTLHFQHLKNVNGGLLHVAASLEEHAAQLGMVLADPASASRRARGFIGSFVRPNGLEKPATPILVETIEAFAARGRSNPSVTPLSTMMLRSLLYPCAVVARVANFDEGQFRKTALRPFERTWRVVRKASRWLFRRLIVWPIRRVQSGARHVRRLTRIAVKNAVVLPARWSYRRAAAVAGRILAGGVKNPGEEVRHGSPPE